MDKPNKKVALLLNGREKHPIESFVNVGNAQRRRKDQIRDAGRHRNSPHRSKIRRSFDEALRDAAKRSDISFNRAGFFVSCLVEEMLDRMMQGQYMWIPRFMVFGIVPNEGQERFRLHAKPDVAVFAHIATELNRLCKIDPSEFWRICQRMEKGAWEQLKRGQSYEDSLLMDRLMEKKGAEENGEFIDLERAQQKRSA
jgi:hypothetical protein